MIPSKYQASPLNTLKFLATFQIIKRLLPAKAVDRLKNINGKSIRDYIDEDNMLAAWGGKDDYEFTFVPEVKASPEPELTNNNSINHNNNSGNINGFKKVSTHTINFLGTIWRPK